uniref:Family with sequence similarity 168 member B n=1 Tax=Moschus moschiferus TaxID=68415 RepID=A0A8C6DGN4_MOSMO
MRLLGSSGVPYANSKGIVYLAGFPMGYTAAAPGFSLNVYPRAHPTFQTGTQLTAHSPTPVTPPHPTTVPMYAAPRMPAYSCVAPKWSPHKHLQMELCSHIMEVPQLVVQASCLQPGLSSLCSSMYA